MVKLWYNILRLIYYPFLVWLLPLFIKKVRTRLRFEKQNSKSQNESFKTDNIVADYAFEVSSEGELEQVKIVIEKLLRDKKNIELIYCSDSVEKQCQNLLDAYPKNLRTLRLPLLSYLPFGKYQVANWLTSKTLFLCRYDFFPELIFYGKSKNVKLILLSGTMKNYAKKKSNFLSKWYYHYVYRAFDKVVMSTDLDKEIAIREFSLPHENIEAYDFRPIQIYKRIRNKNEHLNINFPCFSAFAAFINQIDKSKRVILGSYWNDELVLTAEVTELIKDDYLVAIVPHNLDENSIENIKETINKLDPNLEIYEISHTKTKGQVENTIKQIKNKNGLLILNLKGVLCELYTLFGHAYIAGGFRLSVHSLMEPYLGECMIYCGPKIHRSTEYDLIRQSNPDRVKVIEFETTLISTIKNTNIYNLSSMSSFKTHYEGHYFPLLSWLGISVNLGAVDA